MENKHLYIYLILIKAFMLETKEQERIYHGQSISIRKAIRQMDMTMNESPSDLTPERVRKDINIVVVGPRQSGKTNLLKTITFAYNGHSSFIAQNRQLHHSVYSQIQIKKGKKTLVEGLSKIQKLDDKVGIYGYESIGGEGKNSLQKYSKVMEILGSRMLTCFKEQTPETIKVCVICLSMVEKISSDQLTSLKLFINNLEEERVKYLVVGTKLDLVVNFKTDESFCQQKMTYIDDWCSFIGKELSLRNRNDILCLQSYSSFQKDHLNNSQTINFYALTFLKRCIRKAEETQLQRKKSKRNFLFCTC